MKRHLLFLALLTICLTANAQFKGSVMKKWKPVKPVALKLYTVKPPATSEDQYLLYGKVPGKADVGILIADRSDKHSFRSLARYWSKSQKIKNGDELALKLLAREFDAPKGYDGILEKDAFIPLKKNEMLYLREFRKSFNAKEQDTVEMVELTYVSLHPEMKNQVIVFDLLAIDNDLDTDSIKALALDHIAGIRPIDAMYNRKWTIETNFNLLFGSLPVTTNLDYVKHDLQGNAYYYYITIRPGNLSGTSLALSRNLKKNFLVTGKAGFYSDNTMAYDSLFKKQEMNAPPILYDVTFSASPIGFGQLGMEKRFYMGKRQAVSVMAGARYSFGNLTFKMTGRTALNGPMNEYMLRYKNPLGFDLGAMYRFYFNHQRWGFQAGFEYMYTRFQLDQYTVNGEERPIAEAPYFLPTIRTYDISGIEILFGGCMQF